ncbi:vWA domain-containing protein [Aneurinibacillus tyrosinisolvens]|uniref:vWA domain-containing protein n=1 Tax=Aneurinibacillus tyrosinisolvens TaxID=1443435 RepID=UPI00063F2753|nr:VWA domain-containing protein [Aneurinibacillus tyrosinisolvens]
MQWLALYNLGFLLMIPAILALYLLKRKYEEQEISSTFLWQRLLRDREANRPWQKLKRNLLLLLQLAAAALLILALLKPAVPIEGASAAHTILVVDSSGSMLAKEGEGTRFQLAQKEAETVIEHLSGKQTVTLLEAGIQPRVVLTRSSDTKALRGALASIYARPGTADYHAAFSLAKAIALSDRGSEIIWLGDGAQEGLLASSDHLPAGSFRHIQIGSSRENTAIAVFAAQRREKAVEALLRIDNYGTRKQKGSVIVYGADNRMLDVSGFEVDGNSSRSVTFSNLPQRPAYHAVLKIDGDALAEDNERWSVPFSQEKAKVMLVSPQGNRFVSQALSLDPRVEVEKAERMPDGKKEPVNVWVLDRYVPERLPEGDVLLLAPGKSTDWLPYKTEGEITKAIEVKKQDHPLLKHVDWKNVHIASAASFGEMNGIEPLVVSGGKTLVAAGNIGASRVVILGFDIHASDFALRPAFPIFIQNALSWLSPAQATSAGAAYPGETMTLSFAPGAESRTMIRPDGTREELQTRGTALLYRIPEQTGLYQLEEVEGGRKTVRFFTAEMREEESRITPRAIQVAAVQPDSKEEQSGDGEKKTPGKGGGGQMELTFWLAALALLVAFMEWVVYQRGY